MTAMIVRVDSERWRQGPTQVPIRDRLDAYNHALRLMADVMREQRLLREAEERFYAMPPLP